ncbi:MAG: divergent polysaccharide deacetylase family protein [Desulfarculaceae bacterium]|nr:divergent polysaccharide deacetylase family protein [Desulfarculaceae bacterium]
MAKKKSTTPKKKTTQKKTSQKKKQNTEKPNPVVKEVKKGILAIIILVFIVIFAAMIADLFMNGLNGKKQPDRADRRIEKTEQKPSHSDRSDKEKTDVKTKEPLTRLKEKPEQELKFEIFEGKEDLSVVRDGKKERPEKTIPDQLDDFKKTGALPKVAIIIDDVGYDRRIARTLSSMDGNLTFAILPGAPYGKKIASELHEKGSHIMLHLPMEPEEYPHVDPGTHAILADMSPNQVLGQLKTNLGSVPYIEGVNNHMGSRITTMADKMNQIFTILKKRELFFIDSITSNHSSCESSAKLLNLKFAKRDVFLDNIQRQDYIAGQLEELVKKAESRGRAIGIAHPYDATAETLAKRIYWLKERVELVPASSLVTIEN